MSRFSVFQISVFLCGVLAILGTLFPKEVTQAAKTVTRSSLERFDWFFLLTCSSFIVLALFLGFSRFGKIRLGQDDEKPEFKTISWLAMLFAAGMGSGLVFWGVAEPLSHFAVPPPRAPEGATEIARWSFVITNLHWGFHAWAIYAIAALGIAYFGFRKKMNLIASGPLAYTFKGRFSKLYTDGADILAVLSIVFGVVGSLGMGTLLMNSGISRVFGTENGATWVSILVLVSLTVAFILSALTGLEKGIQILSNFNIGVAVILLLFVLFAGPTHFLLSTFATSIGDYLGNLTILSTMLYPFSARTSWSHDWTLTYLIWWIAWAPFVGIFIARISRGRTIREFVFGVMLLPTFFSIFWFAIFGGSGLHIELFGSGGLAEVATRDANEALFALFQYLPQTQILNIIALILMFVFLVTSADSACFVLGMTTSKGSHTPPTSRKLVWGVIMAIMASAPLVSKGGIEALKATAIVGAIPFTAVILAHIYCLFKALNEE